MSVRKFFFVKRGRSAAMLTLILGIPSLTVRTVAYNGWTYSAAVVPSSAPGLPPVVLLPPIGVGIDRTFCGRFLDAWAADKSAGSALHAIDVIGMGDSAPKPKMNRRLMGGWEAPPRTPREWAEQVVAYVDEEIGEAAVIMGQSNLCTVALEAAALRPSSVCGVILLGPPAVEALSLDKPDESIAKIWRIVGSPIGAALYRSGLGPGLRAGLGPGLRPGLGPGLRSGLGPGLRAGLGPGLRLRARAGVGAGVRIQIRVGSALPSSSCNVIDVRP